MKLHRFFFYLFLFSLPFQTRILFNPDSAYISSEFSYHLGLFLYLSDIFWAILLLDWLIFDNFSIERVKYSNKIITYSCLFIFLSLISLFHVKHTILSLYETIKWLEFFSIVLYISFTTNIRKQFDWILWILFVSGVFEAILAWFQFHMQHMIGLRFLGEYIAPLGTGGLATIETVSGKIVRAYGTFSHSNVLGAFLVLAFVSGLYLFVSQETDNKKTSIWLKASILLGLFIVSVGTFTTFSRLAWAGAALVSFMFLVYLLWNKRKIQFVSLIFLLIVSCATVLTFYGSYLKSRVADSNNNSIEDRYLYNHLGLQMFHINPIFGVGTGSYVPKMETTFHMQPWQYQPAHNIFIFIAVEGGIVGLVLFLLILFEIFRKLRNVPHETLFVSLVSLGIIFLLMGQFDHYFVTIQQGRLMFAIVLGLIAALPNLYEHEKLN